MSARDTKLQERPPLRLFDNLLRFLPQLHRVRTRVDIPKHLSNQFQDHCRDVVAPTDIVGDALVPFANGTQYLPPIVEAIVVSKVTDFCNLFHV